MSPCWSPCATTRPRHASTLLTFDAVVDAIGQIEAKSSDDKAAGTRPGAELIATTKKTSFRRA
jgi:hypothetical protein